MIGANKLNLPPDLENPDNNDVIDGGSLGQTLSIKNGSMRLSKVQFKEAEDKMKRDEMRIKTFVQIIEPEWPEETDENRGRVDEEEFVRIARYAFVKQNQEERFNEQEARNALAHFLKIKRKVSIKMM